MSIETGRRRKIFERNFLPVITMDCYERMEPYLSNLEQKSRVKKRVE